MATRQCLINSNNLLKNKFLFININSSCQFSHRIGIVKKINCGKIKNLK